MRIILKIIVLALFAAGASFLVARENRPSLLRGVIAPQVAIATLITDSERYSDSPVRITGQVVPATRLSIFGFGGFQLRDSSGATIFVLSRGQSLPATGGTATILGTFKPIFQAGSFSYPVLVQD
jgi:hypothetical protein